MMWFWPPVHVRDAATGLTYEVKSVEAALEHMEAWPLPASGKRGPKWRKAYKIAFDALVGMAEMQPVRYAFEATVDEAGFLRKLAP